MSKKIEMGKEFNDGLTLRPMKSIFFAKKRLETCKIWRDNLLVQLLSIWGGWLRTGGWWRLTRSTHMVCKDHCESHLTPQHHYTPFTISHLISQTGQYGFLCIVKTLLSEIFDNIFIQRLKNMSAINKCIMLIFIVVFEYFT